MNLTLAKMIVEWKCWPHFVIAVAGTAEQWKGDLVDPGCGFAVDQVWN